MTNSRPYAGTVDASQIQPGLVTIVMATRGRPGSVAEVFQSLRETTAKKDRVSIWLYVDDDDAVTIEAINKKQFPDPGFPVNWKIGPRPGGLGETHQALWLASGRTSQVYVTSVDDARFITPGWDDMVRAECDKYPDGVLLAFPHDPMTADQATYPIFGWGWLNALGYIYPGYFPYWFDDKWVDQIGRMAGRCTKLTFELPPIGGKGRTKRMRNLPFWTQFLHLMLEERKEAARTLIQAMHPHDTAKREAALARLEQVSGEFTREREIFSDAYCVFQEERFTEMTPGERQLFDAKYCRTEAAAVSRLLARARELVEKKQHAEAAQFIAATQLSDIRVRQAGLLLAECLRAVGRNAEAARVERDTLAAWPQMNLLRRLFRFLGMVANDGKRMLVGMFAKGKK